MVEPPPPNPDYKPPPLWKQPRVMVGLLGFALGAICPALPPDAAPWCKLVKAGLDQAAPLLLGHGGPPVVPYAPVQSLPQCPDARGHDGETVWRGGSNTCTCRKDPPRWLNVYDGGACE